MKKIRKITLILCLIFTFGIFTACNIKSEVVKDSGKPKSKVTTIDKDKEEIDKNELSELESDNNKIQEEKKVEKKVEKKNKEKKDTQKRDLKSTSPKRNNNGMGDSKSNSTQKNNNENIESKKSESKDNIKKKEEYVWVTRTGSKYHSISNCGRTKYATKVPKSSCDLEPCKKCW